MWLLGSREPIFCPCPPVSARSQKNVGHLSRVQKLWKVNCLLDLRPWGCRQWAPISKHSEKRKWEDREGGCSQQAIESSPTDDTTSNKERLKDPESPPNPKWPLRIGPSTGLNTHTRTHARTHVCMYVCTFGYLHILKHWVGKCNQNIENDWK